MFARSKQSVAATVPLSFKTQLTIFPPDNSSTYHFPRLPPLHQFLGTLWIGHNFNRKNPSRDWAEFFNGSSGKGYLDPGWETKNKFGLDSKGQANDDAVNDDIYLTFLLVIYSMVRSLYINPTNSDQKHKPASGCSFLMFFNLVFLFYDVPPWILQMKYHWPSQPAAGCSFYLFYDVAPLPISYDSWPKAITSLLLAVAFTILIVIYSMLWPLYLNPTIADQRPSQACFWL